MEDTMAAQAKSVSVKKRTIRQANQLRTTLASPYAFQTHWVKLSHNVEKEILNSLKSLFEDLPAFTVSKVHQEATTEREKGLLEKVVGRYPSAVKAMRSLIVTGINQVTRGLEQRKIDAVVLNRPSVQGEAVLTDHLKVLSGMREVPVCVVSDLRESLRPLMNLKQLSVIGFRKSSRCPDGLPHHLYQKISRLVQRIQEVNPVVMLPWKHTETGLLEKSRELIARLFPNGSQPVILPKTEPVVGVGQKRKAEESQHNPGKKAKVERELRSPFAGERADNPSEKAKVETMLESPFSQERTDMPGRKAKVDPTPGGRMGVSKGKGMGASTGNSFKYQTSNMKHIIKGEKKSKKKKKRKVKN